ADLAQRPADWQDRDIAEREARATFFSRKRVEFGSEEMKENWTEEFEGEFEHEWVRRRSAYIARIARPKLNGRDLRETYMPMAFLAGVDMEGVRVAGADMRMAHLEEAYLFEAQLQGADMSEAQLQHANLSSAQLNGANLRWAQLQRAYLLDA